MECAYGFALPWLKLKAASMQAVGCQTHYGISQSVGHILDKWLFAEVQRYSIPIW